MVLEKPLKCQRLNSGFNLTSILVLSEWERERERASVKTMKFSRLSDINLGWLIITIFAVENLLMG